MRGGLPSARQLGGGGRGMRISFSLVLSFSSLLFSFFVVVAATAATASTRNTHHRALQFLYVRTIMSFIPGTWYVVGGTAGFRQHFLVPAVIS